MTAREEVLRGLAVELLEALEGEHVALLAQRAREHTQGATVDPKYFPTASTAWAAVEKGAQVMKKARAIPGGSAAGKIKGEVK